MIGYTVEELKALQKMRFKDALDSITDFMLTHSMYGPLFLRCINYLLSKKVQEEEDSLNTLLLMTVDMPLQHKNFPFFPFAMNSGLIFKEREMDELAGWLKAGGDVEGYFQNMILRYSGKSGHVINKILGLATDLAGTISDISQKTGIPIVSLQLILKIIMSPQEPDFLGSGMFKSITAIKVPNNLDQTEIDNMLLKVSRDICQRLKESLRLLIIIDLTEYYNISEFLKKLAQMNKEAGGKNVVVWDSDGPEIKKYLLGEAVCIEEEHKISSIKSLKTLHKYITEKYSYCNLFYHSFNEFIEWFAYKIAIKLQYLEHASLSLTDIKIVAGYDMNSFGRKNKHQIDEDEESGNSPEADDKEENVDKLEECRPETDDKEDKFVKGFSSDNAQSNYSQSFKANKSQIRGYHHSIVWNISKKMHKGLLMPYCLKGDPDAVIKYLHKIIINAGYSEIIEYYNAKLKAIGTSARTVKRYLNQRVIDKDDLSMMKLETVKEEKKLIKQHRKEGYYTQNQLIGFLTNKIVIERYKKEGIILPASKNTLKKRLKPLIEEGEISIEKEHGAYYFNKDPNEIHSIAKALSKP
ncbi:MAG: hypothetical protein WCQ90_07845 [Deltaproteobacteria bacterium]